MSKFIVFLFVVKACICVTAFTMLFSSVGWGVHERVFFGCFLAVVLMYFDAWFLFADDMHSRILEVLELSFSNMGDKERLKSAIESYVRQKVLEEKISILGPLLAITLSGQYALYVLLAWGIHTWLA
jgi:hypothetical protein